MRTYLLFTALHSQGGIQRYNRQLLICLQHILVGSPPTVLSLNDSTAHHGVFGFAGNRPPFVAAALLLPLFRGADLILVGHAPRVRFCWGRRGSDHSRHNACRCFSSRLHQEQPTLHATRI